MKRRDRGGESLRNASCGLCMYVVECMRTTGSIGCKLVSEKKKLK
jgi:hypothetical protein